MSNRDKRILTFLGLLILAACHGGGGGSVFWAGGGPAAVSMACTAWDFRYGTGISGHPLCDANGLNFDFPTSGDVDYLTTNVSLAAKDRAQATIKIAGAGTFTASDGCTPATFGIMLEVRNDDGVAEDGRWWARLQRGPLQAPASYDFDVPISDLAQWSNVQGHIATDRPDQFKAAMANIGAAGLTFGACAFGHGVTAAGAAKMTIAAFSVL